MTKKCGSVVTPTPSTCRQASSLARMAISADVSWEWTYSTGREALASNPCSRPLLQSITETLANALYYNVLLTNGDDPDVGPFVYSDAYTRKGEMPRLRSILEANAIGLSATSAGLGTIAGAASVLENAEGDESRRLMRQKRAMALKRTQ